MRFDWIAFLRRNNIYYTMKGPNASRGRVNIKGPFCGQDDPSEHLGIKLNGNGWSCWRNGAHKGPSSETLVAALLRCGATEARQIVEGEQSATLPSDGDLGSSLRALIPS